MKVELSRHTLEVAKMEAEIARLKAQLAEAQTKIQLLEQDNRYWRKRFEVG